MRVLKRHEPRCERAREWVCLEVDGELSRFEAALADRHVRACTACAAFRGEVRALAEELRAAPLEPLTRPVAVAARRRVAFRPSLQAAVATVAAAAVGVTSLATSLGQQQRRQQHSGGALGARVTVHEQVDALRFRQLRQRTEQLEVIRRDDRPRGSQLA